MKKGSGLIRKHKRGKGCKNRKGGVKRRGAKKAGY